MSDNIGLVTLTAQGVEVDDDPAASLARMLGFELGGDQTHLPYINYIQGYWPGKGTKEGYLRLFADIVAFLKSDATDATQPSIQSYIDFLVRDRHHFYFKDSLASSSVREIAVKDTVLLILGLWTLMRSYFVPLHRHDPHILFIASRANSAQNPLAQSLPNLVSSCGLLPSPKEAPRAVDSSGLPDDDTDAVDVPLFGLHSAIDLVGSLTIASKDLNLFKLKALAGVQVLWTDNISRHLLLSSQGQTHYVELFALPCAFQGGAHDVLGDLGIPTDLLYEIQLSYANLFNPKPPSKLHNYVGRLVGLPFWCWCVSCSSRRLTRRELRRLEEDGSGRSKQIKTARWDQVKVQYDQVLEALVMESPTLWNRTDFENLWPRILALDKCLQEAKPWNFWVLLRDNRDTVQYWTFLFGSIILILTVVQVILGVLQVGQAFASTESSSSAV